MRLIDADALMAEIIKNNSHHVGDYAITFDFGAAAAINNAPTIDAEPVRHGRWVWFENRPVTDADDPECIGCTGYECSECGNNEGTCIRFYEELSPDMLARIKEGLMEYLTNYCPNCGAKMDGKSKPDEPRKICPVNGLDCIECVPGYGCAKMDGGKDDA